MTIEDAQDFRVGSTAVQSLYIGETLVWPMEFDYVISNVVLVYSAGGNQIPASGGYAYFTGRVQQYIHGRPYKDLGTKTLTPHILSGDTSFFSIDGTNIKALSRGKVEGTQKGVVVGYSYATSEVSEGTPVYLQANSRSQKSQTKTTTGYSVSLSTSAINPNAGTITLSGVRTYTQTTVYEYTSLAEDTVVETGKTASQLPTAVTFNTQTGVSYSSGTISITNNHHNTSTRSWTLTATYDGFSVTKDFYQGADSYTDTIRRYDYYANISVVSGQAYAYASNIYLGISAGHTEDTHRDWAYGEDEYLNKQYKTDSVTPVESGDTHNRFSLSGSIVHHDSMGKNETTDYVKYTLTNGGVSNYIELSATNTKWSYVSDKEYGSPWTSQRGETQNYWVSVSSNRYTTAAGACPASGGTCTLTTSGGHDARTVTVTHTPWTKYNITEWDSGSWESSVHSTGEDTSESPGAWRSVSDTPSIYVPSFISRSGSTLTLASEGTSDLPNGRTGTVSAYNGGASDSVTLWQAANVVIPGVEEYISGLALQSGYSSTIPGAGGTSYFNAWSYNQRQDHWSSGSPAGSPVKSAVYSTISVSSAGGSATVSPVSVQTTTERGVTLTVGKNPYGSQKSITVQLKVGGVVKQTLTFTQEATPAVITGISASPVNIDFYYTPSQPVTITATYSDGTTADVSQQCSVSSKPTWVSVTNRTTLYVTSQPQGRRGSVSFWLDSDHTKTTSVSVTG